MIPFLHDILVLTALTPFKFAGFRVRVSEHHVIVFLLDLLTSLTSRSDPRGSRYTTLLVLLLLLFFHHDDALTDDVVVAALNHLLHATRTR